MLHDSCKDRTLGWGSVLVICEIDSRGWDKIELYADVRVMERAGDTTRFAVLDLTGLEQADQERS